MRPVEQLEPFPPSVSRLITEGRDEVIAPEGWEEIEARMWGVVEERVVEGAVRPNRDRWSAQTVFKILFSSLLPAAVGFALGGITGVLGHQSWLQKHALPLAPSATVHLSPTPPAVAPGPSGAAATPSIVSDNQKPFPFPLPFVPSLPRHLGIDPGQALRYAAVPVAQRKRPIPSAIVSRSSPTDKSAAAAPYGDEQTLLERAKAALRQGAPADAYALVQEHRAQFPAGVLAEERELMAIRALAALGQKQELVNRVLDFHRHYPNSLLIPAVDALVPAVSGE